MKPEKRWRFAGTGAWLLLTASVAGIYPSEMAAKVNGQDSNIPYQLRAHTIPRSDNRISLKLLLPETGETIKVTERDGGLIRIERDGQPIIGLVPTIAADGKRSINVTVFRITKILDQAGNPQAERIESLESFDVAKNVPGLTKGEHPVIVELTNVRMVNQQRPYDATASIDVGCCISCGGSTICGGCVELSCGSCCIDTAK